MTVRVHAKGAKWAGGARTALNVSRTLDVFTARATARGSATASPAGAVCSATKVCIIYDHPRSFLSEDCTRGGGEFSNDEETKNKVIRRRRGNGRG